MDKYLINRVHIQDLLLRAFIPFNPPDKLTIWSLELRVVTGLPGSRLTLSYTRLNRSKAPSILKEAVSSLASGSIKPSSLVHT